MYCLHSGICRGQIRQSFPGKAFHNTNDSLENDALFSNISLTDDYHYESNELRPELREAFKDAHTPAISAHSVNLNPGWPSRGAFRVPLSALLFMNLKYTDMHAVAARMNIWSPAVIHKPVG